MLGVCEVQVGEATALFCNQSDVDNCCHKNVIVAPQAPGCGGHCMRGASGICDLAFFCHVPVGIDLCEALPLFWKVFDGEDCRYRADWDAGTAVNAFIGIDVKLRCSRKLTFVFSWM